MHFKCLILLHSVAQVRFAFAFGSGRPINIPASNKSYGPDGPWQAVTVLLGHDAQSLDLYPGYVFATTVLTTDSCLNIAQQPCGAGGLYKPSSSELDTSKLVDQGGGTDWTSGAIKHEQSEAAENYTQSTLSLNIPGQKSNPYVVQNFSIRELGPVKQIYPGGSSYPFQVGWLALGPTTNQSWDPPSGRHFDASIIPNYLQSRGIIRTASYGLHFGSAALKIPLSLYLGGYDMSRAIGAVSTQVTSSGAGGGPSSAFIADLLDIGLGVEQGASPFTPPTQNGLLGSGNWSIGNAPLSVLVNPTAPYLNLPNSTCAAIASQLPVSYQPTLGLWFWNTDDPAYSRVVSSPSYLSFTFFASNLTGGVTDKPSGNITIKIPFALLNLTIEAPLVITGPKQYFPCQPPQGDSNIFSLGRAFLQGAFLGVDWNIDNTARGVWYLAQAPGPNTPSTADVRDFVDPFAASPVDWASTWTGTWTPLSGDGSSPGSSGHTSASSNGGLSGGATAGIGIGCVAAVALVGAVGFFFFQRKRRNQARIVVGATPEPHEKPWDEASSGHPPGAHVVHEAPPPEPREVGQAMAWELPSDERHILPTRER